MHRFIARSLGQTDGQRDGQTNGHQLRLVPSLSWRWRNNNDGLAEQLGI